MSDVAIQPGARRRNHQLRFSRNTASLPLGYRHKPFLPQASQPCLPPDNFVFHPGLRERLLESALQISGEGLGDRG